MPASRKRLLIINTQLKFSGALKKSLESTGDYHVTAFTSPEAAVKFAKSGTVDIAMVDFRMDLAPAPAVIKALRKLHPHIALVVSPATNETLDNIKDLNVQAVIDIPISARELLPLLEQAFQDVQQGTSSQIDQEQSAPSQAQPSAPQTQTPKKRIDDTPKDTGKGFEDGTSTLEVDMSDIEGLQDESPPEKYVTPVKYSKVDAPPPKPTDLPVAHPEDPRTAEEKLLEKHDTSLFKRIEADEPPIMSLSEGGTVRDLRSSVLDTGMRNVIEILSNKTSLVEPVTLPVDDGDTDIPNLARAILADSIEPSVPLDVLEATGAAAVAMDDDEAEELEADLGKSSPIEPPQTDTPPRPSTLPGGAPIKPEPPKPGVLPSSKPSSLPTSQQPETPAPQEPVSLEQLAVTLTQASLELTAEATLLAREDEILAMAGKMHKNDVQEIGKLIDNDWTANADQSRIRFVHLSGTGKDYMLFTQRTEIDDHLALTMIFAGNIPLRVIRRQSSRLLEALHDVPDVAPVERFDDEPVEQPSELLDIAGKTAYKGEKMAHSYIWLLHQDIEGIDINTAHVLVTELNRYLQGKMWEVHTLDVEEDYIYLYADIPGEPVAHELIRKLKDRSAKVIRKQHPTLTGKQIWADAYLTLVPGREMNMDEIQRFIRFGRM